MEALIPVYESGKWVADMDFFKGSESTLLSKVETYQDEKDDTMITNLTAIDKYADLLDAPENIGTVRAHKEWQARLSIAAISLARGCKTLLLPERVCWSCLNIVLHNF